MNLVGIRYFDPERPKLRAKPWIPGIAPARVECQDIPSVEGALFLARLCDQLQHAGKRLGKLREDMTVLPGIL